jgi:hypothetical protein
VAKRIRESLTDGWRLDLEVEERTRQGVAADVHCFTCSNGLNGSRRRRAATVFLMGRENVLRVANIVPDETPNLSREEFNAILEEFWRNFAKPAASQFGATCELTEPEADLEQWMSPETAKKLRTFSDCANKRTGSSHPADKDLWYDFILAAHEEASDFSASTLMRWLVEEGEWSEDIADELAIEYERERGLLHFQKEKGGTPQHAQHR